MLLLSNTSEASRMSCLTEYVILSQELNDSDVYN